jgi:hypothetical protein
VEVYGVRLREAHAVNWLGLSLRSLLGIVLGALVGVLLFLYEWPNVVVIGLATGAGCALAATDKSPLRGVSVATVATWAAAIVDAHRLGVSVFAISSTLTWQRWLAYLGCVGLAFLLGGSTARRAANVRTAGT